MSFSSSSSRDDHNNSDDLTNLLRCSGSGRDGAISLQRQRTGRKCLLAFNIISWTMSWGTLHEWNWGSATAKMQSQQIRLIYHVMYLFYAMKKFSVGNNQSKSLNLNKSDLKVNFTRCVINCTMTFFSDLIKINHKLNLYSKTFLCWKILVFDKRSEILEIVLREMPFEGLLSL